MTSRNACKACGLGMGGQRGGMRNELDEFPSVCNKSVQAQETDIQPPIPLEVFEHTIEELDELSGYELEHLGRLGTPLIKSAASNRYAPIGWDEAVDAAAGWFRSAQPERTFFYSSGRSSNEAGFVLQLFARLYGTNNVNNCSYYCHQATSVALGNTIGTGTSTIELRDLSGADLVFVIGANPSSNHPRLIHRLKACREGGGEVIVINPAKEPGLVKFAVPKSPSSLIAGGSVIASQYLQPNIGTDIALLKGIAKAVLAGDAHDRGFIAQYTTGFEAYRADLDATSWQSIVDLCGVPRESIERAAARYADAENVVFAWGMGMTHHLHGVANIEEISNLAILRGMVGRPNAGLLPLRGHSNVQGIGTIGVKPVLAQDVFDNIEASFGIELPTEPGLDTMASMQAAAQGRIDLALMMGGNLLGSNPNSSWAKTALDQVARKIYLTTTLNRGHVSGVSGGEALILPVAARDEERQPTTQESMFNFVRMSDGGIERIASVRPETAIICDIAARALEDGPLDFREFESHETIRAAIAKVVPGMEDLASIDVAKKEFHVRGRVLHEPEFRTHDKRAHFVAHSPPRLERRKGEFMLATLRSEGQFNTMIYEEHDAYRGTRGRWVVMMNRADMDEREIALGSKITIVSAHGRMADVEAHPFDVPPGNMLAYFPEANALTGIATDPHSKTPAFKSTPVWIEGPGRPLAAARH